MRIHQEQRQNADRQIDVEDPAPGVVVRDPAAQRRADGRRQHRGDAVKREGHAAFLRRESIGQNGLRHRLQSAAARALHHAEENQHRRGSGADAAKQRTDREQEDAEHEEALAAEQAGEPSADGKNDGVRHQVGSQHPGAFVVAGAEVAGNVRQRDVGDAGIEHFHERRHGHHHGDQPGIELRRPWLGGAERS